MTDGTGNTHTNQPLAGFNYNNRQNSSSELNIQPQTALPPNPVFGIGIGSDFQSFQNYSQPAPTYALELPPNPSSFQLNNNQPIVNPGLLDRSKFYFDGEYKDSDSWKDEYQRNNRNGGMKNIRCFPYCSEKHYASGFCGQSIVLKVRTNYLRKEVLAYAEITLAANQPNVGSSKNKNPTKPITLGTVLSYQEIQTKLRTRENAFKDWWTGDIRETKELNNEREISFEFNRAKRGWHYGWIANKYISDSKHNVKVYLFIPMNTNFLSCVSISVSPEFRLYSRKPKRYSILPNIEQESKRVKASMNILTENIENSPQNSTYDFSQAQSAMALDNFLSDDLFLGNPETIVNHLGVSRKQFKGANVFKMLQKLLLLSKEDFTKYLTNKTKKDKSSTKSDAKYREIIALRAFAAFLLSDEEDITAEIQAKMDGENPFDEKHNNSQFEISKEQPERKVNELLTVAQKKFDKFLSTFNLNTDIYTKFCEKKKLNVQFPQSLFQDKNKNEENEEQIEENSEKTIIKKKKHDISVINSIGVTEFFNNITGSWGSSKETLKLYDKMYNIMSIPYALRKCYLSITGQFSFTFELHNGTPSIITKYCPKLFSAGRIRYTFDGMRRPWPIASPLISTKYDAIAVRAYLQENKEVSTNTICLEHIYPKYKMIREMRVGPSKQLIGIVKLFEKWEDFDGTFEWTEILRGDIKFDKVEVEL